MKLISWNINGIRAIEKKGFREWLESTNADIISLQEVKAQQDQLAENLTNIPGYNFYLACAQRKGYSGVCCYSKEEPLSVKVGLNDDNFNTEGRVLRLEYPEFYLYNIYFPNGSQSKERLQYKLDFNMALYHELEELMDKGKGIIICGDVNIAHEEIDLKNPKANEMHSGFLPQERRFIDRLLDLGFVDSFRELNPDKEKYSWWSYRFGARKTNAGWRIDYFFVSKNLLPNIIGADVNDDIEGSDHAPISLELDFNQ